jgi:hypothetical protein
MRFVGLPQFEEMSLDLTFRLNDADARSVGNLQRASQAQATDPMGLYASMERDLKQLFAAGFDFSFDKFDMTLPQGKIVSKMSFAFASSDPATFEWTSLLLGTEASIDLSIPAALVDTLGPDNPQLAMAVGGGYLVRKGEDYVLEARMKKGLLTLNGAPMPIPLGTN